MKYIINSNNTVVFDTENNIAIPVNESNRHYQEYLAWISEGNEPEVMQEETYG